MEIIISPFQSASEAIGGLIRGRKQRFCLMLHLHYGKIRAKLASFQIKKRFFLLFSKTMDELFFS